MNAKSLRTVAGLLAAAALAVAPQAVQAQPNTGSANFSKYVALGDSITAGFNSGSLVVNYQRNSYPALIYRQATGNTTGFEQPTVSSPGIPNILRLNALLPNVSLGPVPGQGVPTNLNLPRPYDNMAVPGADVHDLLFTTSGGLHDLILRGQGFSQIQQGLSLNPTFVTLWIGNNDALGAATGGIVNDNTLTPLADFQAKYTAAVGAILSRNAKYATATIPDVTTLPFVTTVPKVINLPSGPFTLHGPQGPLQAGDFVLLTASTLIPQGFGVPEGIGGRGPLPDSVVLSAAEVATIRARVAGFNAIIRSTAQANNAALFDAEAVLRQAATTGINIGGVTYSSRFLTGGIFSYDGVHPTDLGYAYIANQFIEAINEKFGAGIPPVNLYPFIFGPPAFPTGASPAGGDFDVAQIVLTEEAWQSLRSVVDADKADKPVSKPPRRRRGGRR
jgi:lysophospholipase L1-like esterase